MSWTPPRAVSDVDLRAIFLSLSSFMDGIVSGPGSVGTTHLTDGSVTTAKLADRSVTQAKLALGAVEDTIGTRVVTDAVTYGGSYITAGQWKVTSATANFTDLDEGKPVYVTATDGSAGITSSVWKTGAYIYQVEDSTTIKVRSKNPRQITMPAAASGLKMSIGGLPRSLDIYTTTEDESWGFRQYASVEFTAGQDRTFGDVGHSIIFDIDLNGHGQNIFPQTGYGPSGVYNIFGNVNYITRAGYRGGGVSFLSNIWHGNDASLTDPDPFTVMFGCIMQPYINSFGEHLTYHGQIDVERTMLEGYVDQPVLQGQPRSGHWGTLDFRGFDVTSFEGDEFVGNGAVVGERNGAWMRETPRLDIKTISVDNPASTANAIIGGSQITVGMTGKTFIFDTPISEWPTAGEFYVFTMDNLTDRNFVGSARVTYTGHGTPTGSGSTLRYYLTGCTVEDGPSGYLDDADPRGRLTVATTYTDFVSTTVTTTFGTSGFNGEVGDEIVVGSNASFAATGYLVVPSGGSTGESIIYYGGKSGTTKFTYCQLIEGGGTTLAGATIRHIYPATAAYWNGEAADVLRLLDVTAWGSGVPAGVDDFKFTVMADDGPWVGTYRAVSGTSITYVTAYSKDRTWIRTGAQISTSGIIQRRYGFRVDPLFRAQYGYPFIYGYSDTAYTWLMDKYGTDWKRLASSSGGVDRSIAAYGAPVTTKLYGANGTPYTPTQITSSDKVAEWLFYGRTGVSTWVDLASIRVVPSQNPTATAHGGKIIFGLVQTNAATMTDALTLSFPTGSGSTGGLLADFAGRLTTAERLTVSAGGVWVTGNSSITGQLAMNTSKITGLGDPTAAQDAATKTYVDSSVSAVSGKAYVFGTSIVSDVAPGGTSGTYADLSGVTWTVPSGTIAAAGDKLKLTMSFTTGTTGNPATNLAFRVLMGGNVMWDTDTYWATTASAGVIIAQCELIRTSSATGIRMIGRTASRNVTVTANKGTEYTGGLTVNNMDSSSNVVKVQAKHTHTNDLVLTSAVLEVIKA